MFTPHEQNAGHNHHGQTAIKSFENVAKLKYVKIPVTNQNSIYEGIKRRLIWGINAKIWHKVSLPGCHLKWRTWNTQNCYSIINVFALPH